MPQIFHHSTNALARATIFGAVFILLAALVGHGRDHAFIMEHRAMGRAPTTRQFSHKHHVGDDGIDCRYCHTSVETAASAGIPSTSTCMNCHKQIWADSPYLEPVRESFRTGKPIEWMRVHDLPDYAYFNHSIHVNKGVGCSTCHGRVDQMPITYEAAHVQMEWCLECHRNPEQFVRPKDKVFDMEWRPENKSKSELQEGRSWVSEYHVQPANVLTSCSTCHR